MEVVAIKMGEEYWFNRSAEFVKTAKENPKVGTAIEIDLPITAPAIDVKRAVNKKMEELNNA